MQLVSLAPDPYFEYPANFLSTAKRKISILQIYYALRKVKYPSPKFIKHCERKNIRPETRGRYSYTLSAIQEHGQPSRNPGNDS